MPVGPSGSACSTQSEAPPPAEEPRKGCGDSVTVPTLGMFATGQALAEGFPGIFYFAVQPRPMCG